MKMKIEVLDLERDDLINIISGFSGYSGYWSILSWDDDEYSKARESILDSLEDKDETICFEEVLSDMLLDQKYLVVTDPEEVYEDKKLNLEKLINGVNLSIQENGVSANNEDWDAVDCDIIVQNALFNEVVFG